MYNICTNINKAGRKRKHIFLKIRVYESSIFMGIIRVTFLITTNHIHHVPKVKIKSTLSPLYL